MAFDLENRKLNAIHGTGLPLLRFVMCGGSGSRLWPLSRIDKPKQFHRLSGEESLLSETLKRLQSAPALNGRITVIGAKNHQMQIEKTISAGSDVKMILEPVPRNTAAVAALATLSALAGYDDALMLLCPADHDISSTEQFWQSVVQGIPAANRGVIVTFGLLPERPETGYGYIEAGEPDDSGYTITRFVEKPDHETALAFIRQGSFFWNSGIFLFRARIMREAFLQFAPDIWHHTESALQHADCSAEVTYLPDEFYQSVPAVSFDHAIMEKADRRVLIPASFSWSDLGSWQSLCKLEQQHDNQDDCGNVLIGDVIAHDCSNSYIRSEAGLLTISGLKDMAVIALKDATFISPLAQSHQVQTIVRELTQQKRAELYYEQPVYAPDIHRQHVKDWLFEKALPYWALKGADHRHGGFYESLTLQGLPVAGPRRTRTMARQIYVFAKGLLAGWAGASSDLVSHGLLFMQERGRSRSGGWVQSFNTSGEVAQARENFYDQTCMLLALSYAHQAGHNQALQLGQETFAFLDNKLAHIAGGFYENRADRDNPRALLTSNAHMHYLEACLAWHEVTGDDAYLRRADEVVELCKDHFFDRDYWCLTEFFQSGWRQVADARGDHTEPGHYFEWAALLSDYANRTGCREARRMAHRLYSCTLSTGINRSTGLAYNSVSREGRPIDRGSRSWQQCEALKAAIMLDGYNDQDLKPEIEARIATLFRWHLQPAQEGLWFDRLDASGTNCSDHVPASILYHLVSALTLYLQPLGKVDAKKPVNKQNMVERVTMPV